MDGLLGAPKPYSVECVEGEFRELRRDGVSEVRNGAAPNRASIQAVARTLGREIAEKFLASSMCALSLFKGSNQYTSSAGGGLCQARVSSSHPRRLSSEPCRCTHRRVTRSRCVYRCWCIIISWIAGRCGLFARSYPISFCKERGLRSAAANPAHAGKCLFGTDNRCVDR